MLSSLPCKEKWANMFPRISTWYQEVCVCVCWGVERGRTVQSEIVTSCGQWLVNKILYILSFPEDNYNQNNFKYNIVVNSVA